MAKINKRFQDYVDGRNLFARIRGAREITFPLKQEDVMVLSRSLSAELSPENLSCDGELPRAKVIARRNKFEGVAKDLKTYCEKNGLRWVELYY